MGWDASCAWGPQLLPMVVGNHPFVSGSSGGSSSLRRSRFPCCWAMRYTTRAKTVQQASEEDLDGALMETRMFSTLAPTGRSTELPKASARKTVGWDTLGAPGLSESSAPLVHIGYLPRLRRSSWWRMTQREQLGVEVHSHCQE